MVNCSHKAFISNIQTGTYIFLVSRGNELLCNSYDLISGGHELKDIARAPSRVSYVHVHLVVGYWRKYYESCVFEAMRPKPLPTC